MIAIVASGVDICSGFLGEIRSVHRFHSRPYGHAGCRLIEFGRQYYVVGSTRSCSWHLWRVS